MPIAFEKLMLPFIEDEIEFRIGQAGKKGNGQIWATCLAYVQARAIMNRLDEVCGPQNWSVGYRFASATEAGVPGVICVLCIKDEKGEWISKEDGAEQTDIESFKGGLSSALKRAGSVWGIGRYLYGLDSAFARIVEKGTKEARYGKLKDGGEFYWLPPALPAWALPKGEIPRGMPEVYPSQPNPGDGFEPEGYVIPYGPLAKQSVLRADPIKLREYVLSLEEKAKVTGKTPIWAQELIKNAEPVIAAFENEPGSGG